MVIKEAVICSKEAENVAIAALEETIEKSEKDISLEDTDGNVAKELMGDISPTADNDVITLVESDDSSNDDSFQNKKRDISSKRKRLSDVLDNSTDASQFDDSTSRFGDEIILSDDDDDSADFSNDKFGNFLFYSWRHRSRLAVQPTQPHFLSLNFSTCFLLPNLCHFFMRSPLER